MNGILVLLLAAFAGPARAEGVRITLTPSIEFGVVVDTASVAFTLGASSPAFTTAPIGVQIVGSAQPVELDLSGSIASPVPWTLDATGNAEADKLRVYAVFSNAALGTRPADSEYVADANLVTASPRRAGGANGGGTNYEGPTLLADMDALAVGAQRRLWLRLDGPSASTTAKPQTVTITITATRDAP